MLAGIVWKMADWIYWFWNALQVGNATSDSLASWLGIIHVNTTPADGKVSVVLIPVHMYQVHCKAAVFWL